MRRLGRWTSAVMLAVALTACGSPIHRHAGTAAGPSGAQAPPWQAQAGTQPQWREWFARQRAALVGAHPRAVFLGDSILFAWPIVGTGSWRRFGLYQPVDLGVPGDTTQNILWRIDHGELSPLQPGVVVIMAGTNDLGRWSATDVVKGVEAVVGSAARVLPRAHLVLLGVLPIDPPGTRRHREVAAVDQALADYYRRRPVTYIDLRARFAGPDGTLRPSLYQPACVPGTDFCDQLVHPSAQGYEVMGRALDPVLASLSG